MSFYIKVNERHLSIRWSRKHACTNDTFYRMRRNSVKNPVLENKKNNKKSSTRGMKIGHVFRRSLSKDQSASLFGIPLCKLTDGEILPKPIMVSVIIG